MKSNLRKKLVQGVSYGAWVTIGNPDVSDILQGLPFDWLVFDTEHSPIGAETVSHMIQVLDEEKVSPSSGSELMTSISSRWLSTWGRMGSSSHSSIHGKMPKWL